MSQVIDAQFSDEERDGYLDEVREHLPAFLSEVAYDRPDPAGDVSALLNLGEDDLNRVVDTHLAFAAPIIDFVQALPEGLRRPLSSSMRPPVVSQAVRGPVDWAATQRERCQQGGNQALTVVRSAERIFDAPENQALLWFLQTLRTRIAKVKPVEYDRSGAMEPGESWWPHVIDMSRDLEEALRPRWLAAVTPVQPTPTVMTRLRSSRQPFYAEKLPAAIEAFERYTDEPSSEDITELLCQRYFEPRLNWQLFELVVALRLTRAVEQRLGTKRSPTRLLVGRKRRPFAEYDLAGGDVVKFWYQGWPKPETRSLLKEVRARHDLRSGSSRPDFVLERHSGEELVDAILLEVKASRSKVTLGIGMQQMLGYLMEWPDLWPKETPGWLVAPKSDVFQAAEAKGEPLWMVDSDEVAAAAAGRLLA